MRNRKRCKKDWELIKDVNDMLRFNRVKSQTDNLFAWLCNWLLAHDKYEGFNFYKIELFEGKEITRLAGSYDPDKFDCLQIN